MRRSPSRALSAIAVATTLFAAGCATAPRGTGDLGLVVARATGSVEIIETTGRTRLATVPGLGDAGAHCGMICDGSFPTFLLSHWGKDRKRGEKLPVEWLVKRQTADTADLVGLGDRGRIAPGMRADLNLIDWDALRLRPPEMVFDLPAGGKRLVQRVEGYHATLVAGEVTFQGGEATGALPGRLVRGAQPAPAGAGGAA